MGVQNFAQQTIQVLLSIKFDAHQVCGQLQVDVEIFLSLLHLNADCL